MKRINKIYDGVAQWLCSFESNKYVHLVVGLLIGFLGSLLFAATTKNGTEVAYAFCGWFAAMLIGLLKEVVDFFRDKLFDAKDWLFTAVGGAVGAILWLL